MWRIGGPAFPQVSTTKSLIARAPASAPKTPSTCPSVGSSKIARASACGTGAERAGIGRPTTRDLRAIPGLDRIGEEESACERRREPVRETEVRIGLGQRRRNAKRRRSEDHRTGDETAAAEDDVRAPPPQDRAAGVRRRTGEQQRTRKRERRPPRKALDPERDRTRSPHQERAALRRAPATRRTSRARPAPSALLRSRAPAARDLPSRRPRSDTEAVAAPPR